MSKSSLKQHVALIQLLIQLMIYQGNFLSCIDLNRHNLLYFFLELPRFAICYLRIYGLLLVWFLCWFAFAWIFSIAVGGWTVHGSLVLLVHSQEIYVIYHNLDTVDWANIEMIMVSLTLSSACFWICLIIRHLTNALLEDFIWNTALL